MPKTSAVSLLPLPSTPPATGLFAKSNSAASDTSFRQTLESARQQESSRKPDDTDADEPDKSAAAASKKASKSTKPKRTNTKDAKKGEPTDDAMDDGTADATTASDATTPAEATGDATEEDAGPDEHADAKDEAAKVAGAAADPTAAASAANVQAVTPQTAKSAAPAKANADEPKAAPTKHGAIVVDAKKAAQSADDSTDGQTPGASADADATTTATTAATAQAAQAAPAKGAGLGTGKVVSHGLMDSGSNPAATDAATAASAAASAPTTPSAVSSDIEGALGTIEDALASGDGDDHPSRGVGSPDSPPVAGTFEQQLQRATTPAKADALAPATSPEVQFAEANHPKVVTGVQSQLLPNGGSMQIRLDPPELGALQVTVHMRDGVMTAAFETSNDDATRMLSHSLNQLKTVLESVGVSVEKLHVQQAPKQESQGGQDQQQQGGGGSREQQQEARQEQQRREILQRMWRKLSGAGDPIDFVA